MYGFTNRQNLRVGQRKNAAGAEEEFRRAGFSLLLLHQLAAQPCERHSVSISAPA